MFTFQHEIAAKTAGNSLFILRCNDFCKVVKPGKSVNVFNLVKDTPTKQDGYA